MATRWRALHKRKRGSKQPRPRSCQVCRSKYIIECCLDPWERPIAYLCSTHARRQGFCGGCGLFCAGITSFDFGEPPGFCDNCQAEIRSDCFDEYEDGDDYDEWNEALDNCGQDRNGYCSLAGTEACEFDCPFNR